jgi:hypothetical protein
MGDNECFKDFWNGCWQLMFNDFGDLEMMSVQCVSHEERILIALWELHGFWEQGDTGE